MKMSSKRNKKKKKKRTLESNSCTVFLISTFVLIQPRGEREREKATGATRHARRISHEKNERTRSASASNGFTFLPVTIITRYEL